MIKEASHADYPAFLAALKERILHARSTAARAVNRELALLYWDIGRAVVEKQQLLGWGESVIDRLSADLQDAFPRTTGFSPRNMRDMKRFYLAYSDESIWRQPVAKLSKSLSSDRNQNWQQAVAKLDESSPTTDFLRQLVAQVPWGQHLLILNKLTDPPTRLYYLRATAQLGWSRSVLLNQIKARAYERAVKEKKTNNFALALPEHFAEQADEMMKSRYSLEFLGISRPMKERELEDRLIDR
jgi:predicted DNA-binding transcriptional regulator AlpA